MAELYCKLILMRTVTSAIQAQTTVETTGRNGEGNTDSDLPDGIEYSSLGNVSTASQLRATCSENVDGTNPCSEAVRNVITESSTSDVVDVNETASSSTPSVLIDDNVAQNNIKIVTVSSINKHAPPNSRDWSMG